ncbi:MAG: hypothetical protein AVDCRST_MAG88-119 [uncultured Thermomicrobiales bacterium]|uniref:Cation efflux protein cytoplasmic domain-containing protein n=1 Tax=uncultured Thermomicrobiales bacterium TaxID=1645740 RepID=A0A6J4U6R2_9BACT|nr:MAG: hypothetical protein AVDCRST_MAG88-119 [uncultured Thermomicrobiales bacterium]
MERAGNVRVRWLGHQLQAELQITVNEDLPARVSHHIAEEVQHALFHALPRREENAMHINPCGHGGEDWHTPTAHHVQLARRAKGPVGPPGTYRQRR